MTDQLVIVGGLILAGYALLAVELFVMPGFGFAGIGGLLCFGAGCILAFRWWGTVYGSLAVLFVVASVTLILAWIPRSRIGDQVIHRGSLATAHSIVATLQVGDQGVAESDLRPSGIARFGDRRESVVTDGDFVTAGTPVRVAEVEGARISVEPLPEPEPAA